MTGFGIRTGAESTPDRLGDPLPAGPRRRKFRRLPLLPFLLLGSLAILYLACCREKGSQPILIASRNSVERGFKVVQSEDIFLRAPFAQCHASTIVETGSGLVVAWFGGTAEGHPDVGIWLSRREGPAWSSPVEVFSSLQEGGLREPCWNPVLFEPEGGPLILFWKAGPSPSRWRGLMATSTDDGRTWSSPRNLPPTILGPAKNRPLEFPGGVLLCGSSSEDAGWRVHFELTEDQGRTWHRTADLNDGRILGLIQPALLRTAGDEVLALMRSTAGRIYAARSRDRGGKWSRPEPLDLPNPNSGIDAATLADGRHVLVFNPVAKGRTPLCLAVSRDGRHWNQVLTLEDEKGAEFSYPAIIQSKDGLLHIVYTWKRLRIRHAVLDPGRWP